MSCRASQARMRLLGSQTSILATRNLCHLYVTPHRNYYITIHYITLYYIVLYYILLRYIVVYYITLCYIVLYYVMLYYMIYCVLDDFDLLWLLRTRCSKRPRRRSCVRSSVGRRRRVAPRRRTTSKRRRWKSLSDAAARLREERDLQRSETFLKRNHVKFLENH